MLKTNMEIAGQAEDIRKRLSRVEEGFRLAKEDVLKEPDIESLMKFRQQTRIRFAAVVNDMARQLRTLRSMLNPDQAGLEEVTDLLDRLEIDIGEIQARLTSTPSRFIRLFRAGALGGGEVNRD